MTSLAWQRGQRSNVSPTFVPVTRIGVTPASGALHESQTALCTAPSPRTIADEPDVSP